MEKPMSSPLKRKSEVLLENFETLDEEYKGKKCT